MAPAFIQSEPENVIGYDLSSSNFTDYRTLDEDPIKACYDLVQRQYLEEGFPWIPRMQARGSSLPLRGYDTAGLCGHYSDLAKAVLCRRYKIPEDVIHSQCMGLLQNDLGKQEEDRHAFLYLPHAERFFGGEPFDEFIDYTSSQFSGQAAVTGDHSFDGLYKNLSFHGGAQGKSMVRDLFRRGAVSIPHTEAGTCLLSLLVSSYAPYDSSRAPELLSVSHSDLSKPNSIHHYEGLTADDWLKRQLPYLQLIE